MKFKKLTSIILLFTLAILLVSCATDNKKDLNNGNQTVVKDNPNQDKDLTSELLEEKEVSEDQVYLQVNG